jgi:hypothetical protein
MADDEEALTMAVVRLASRYGRYGYRRVTAMLQWEGWRVNHKLVERLATGRTQSTSQTAQAWSTLAY